MRLAGIVVAVVLLAGCSGTPGEVDTGPPDAENQPRNEAEPEDDSLSTHSFVLELTEESVAIPVSIRPVDPPAGPISSETPRVTLHYDHSASGDNGFTFLDVYELVQGQAHFRERAVWRGTGGKGILSWAAASAQDTRLLVIMGSESKTPQVVRLGSTSDLRDAIQPSGIVHGPPPYISYYQWSPDGDPQEHRVDVVDTRRQIAPGVHSSGSLAVNLRHDVRTAAIHRTVVDLSGWGSGAWSVEARADGARWSASCVYGGVGLGAHVVAQTRTLGGAEIFSNVTPHADSSFQMRLMSTTVPIDPAALGAMLTSIAPEGCP